MNSAYKLFLAAICIAPPLFGASPAEAGGHRYSGRHGQSQGGWTAPGRDTRCVSGCGDYVDRYDDRGRGRRGRGVRVRIEQNNSYPSPTYGQGRPAREGYGDIYGDEQSVGGKSGGLIGNEQSVGGKSGGFTGGKQMGGKSGGNSIDTGSDIYGQTGDDIYDSEQSDVDSYSSGQNRDDTYGDSYDNDQDADDMYGDSYDDDDQYERDTSDDNYDYDQNMSDTYGNSYDDDQYDRYGRYNQD